MALDCLTDTKIWPARNSSGPFKANGAFTFADAVKVKFRLVQKKDGTGLFLAFPSSPNKRFDSTREISAENPKYYDEVLCTSAEVYQELLTAASRAYQAAVDSTHQEAGAVVRDNVPTEDPPW